jgi:outer membrane protein assembly factor BamB
VGGIVWPRGPDGAAAVDPRTGHVRWTLSAGREASLTGDLPQLHSLAGQVTVAIRRNLGVDLHLVRPEGGPAWGTRSVFLPADRFDLRHADSDVMNLYYPHDDRLTAVRIDDGTEVWSVSLPATHGSAKWVAKAAAGGVIVYPTHAIPEEPVPAVAARVGRSFLRWPAARRVAGLSFTLYEGWAARTVPVLVLDADRGRELRRFELTAAGPFVAVNFTPGTGMTVVTGTKVYTLE